MTVGGVADPERKVADVKVDSDGQVRLFCHDPSREAVLKQLFLEDLSAFVAVGEAEPGGCCADGVKTLSAGSSEALQQILEDELYGFSLVGRIVS